MNRFSLYCAVLFTVFSAGIKAQGDSIRIAFKCLETIERFTKGDTSGIWYANETTHKQKIIHFVHRREKANKYPDEQEIEAPALSSAALIDINELTAHFNKWSREKNLRDTDSVLIKGDSVSFLIRPIIRKFKTSIVGSSKGKFNCELQLKLSVFAYPDEKFFMDSVDLVFPWVDFSDKDSIDLNKKMIADAEAGLKKLISTVLFSEKFETAFKEKLDSICHPPIPEPILLKIANLDTSANVADKTKGVVTIKTSKSHGSGCIVSQDGYILTNYHVIDDDSVITVFNENIESISAKVIRVNKKKDLALLKIDKNELYVLKLKPEIVRMGDEVYAIGTASNIELGQSVSKGIVSSVRVLNKTRYIQSDAKINFGTTGGAMIDNSGNLIGIVNAKLIGRGVEGISFAIPAAVALKFLNIHY